MKKVLIVMSSLHGGGAERSLINFLTELPPDAYDLHLLLLKQEGMFLTQLPEYVKLVEPPDGLRQLYGPLDKAGKYLPCALVGNFVSLLRSRRSGERRGFRWQHFYGPAIPALPGSYDVAAAYITEDALAYVDEKVTARRKVAWVRNDCRFIEGFQTYDAPRLARMDAVATVSETCVQALAQQCPELTGKLYLLKSIIRCEFLRCRAEEFYPPEFVPDEVNLLTIGRLTQQKGLDMAIEAAALLQEQKVSFHWFVLGKGELEKELRHAIQKRGLEKKFLLLGTRENPYPYMKHCTVLIQPSRWEGKSNVLNEAKSLGTPIVATRYETVEDQILPDQEGIIVSMDPTGIADGIRRILIDGELREHLREYLSSNDYGNCSELARYLAFLDGPD